MICDRCNADACLWDQSLKNTVCGACGGINTAWFEHTEASDNCQDQANMVELMESAPGNWEVSEGADKEPVAELYTHIGSLTVSFDRGMISGAHLFRSLGGHKSGHFCLDRGRAIHHCMAVVNRLHGIPHTMQSENI